jgi:hypothetical protein
VTIVDTVSRAGKDLPMIGTPRRLYRRQPLRAVTPVLDSSNGRFLTGHSRDVSYGGIFVELGEPPPIGTLVDLFVGGVGIGTQVFGRVVRVEDGVGFAAAFTSETTAIAPLLRRSSGSGSGGARH